MKQKHVHVLDLAKMDGDGEFPCPECGTTISPDDCSEESYSILEIKINLEGLEEVIIKCNRCASQLHLTGFSLLLNLPDASYEKNKGKKEENLCYIAHV